MVKKPTYLGHKCLGVRVAYKARCECGWESQFIYGGKFGAGGRAGAYDEWRSHVEKCDTTLARVTGAAK